MFIASLCREVAGYILLLYSCSSPNSSILLDRVSNVVWVQRVGHRSPGNFIKDCSEWLCNAHKDLIV